MKFALFAFIAGLCLVASTVNANAVHAPVEDFEVEFISQEFANDIVEIEKYGIFNGIYWVLKGALRTLKGLNCSIQGAVNMKNSAQKFIDDIQACGGTVSSQVQDIINTCKSIISTANDIINAKTNVCNIVSDDTAAAKASTRTGWNCFWKMLKQFITLKNQIKTALAQIQKVPSDTSECVKSAVTTLTTTFTGFPAFVKNCSKLTS